MSARRVVAIAAIIGEAHGVRQANNDTVREGPVSASWRAESSLS
jgi:hypothetical protein